MKLKNPNFGTNTITASKFVTITGIANTNPYISGITVTDSNWATISSSNTANYFIISGGTFNSNTKVYINNTLTSSTVVSGNLRVTNTSSLYGKLNLYNLNYGGYIESSGLLNLFPIDYGYLVGGHNLTAPAVTVTATQRLTFSSDTTTLATKGTLAAASVAAKATSDRTYVWSAGGGSLTPAVTNSSIVSRILISSDTSTLSSRGNLSLATFHLGASGNMTYGWWFLEATGTTSGAWSAVVSNISRTTYATDTAASTNRAQYNPSTNVSFSDITLGTMDYAWQIAGRQSSAPATVLSSIYRLNYSADTVQPISRGTVSTARYWVSGSNNNDYAWVSGGTTAAPANATIIDRMLFSSDTAAMQTRSNVGTARSQHSTVGNNDYAYLTYNYAAPISTAVDRLDYANDTTNPSARTFQSLATGWHAHAGGFPG